MVLKKSLLAFLALMFASSVYSQNGDSTKQILPSTTKFETRITPKATGESGVEVPFYRATVSSAYNYSDLSQTVSLA